MSGTWGGTTAPWHVQNKESRTFNSSSDPVAELPGCVFFFSIRAIFKDIFVRLLKMQQLRLRSQI